MSKRGIAALAAALVLLYAAALTGPVLYDDTSHVRDNPVFLLPFREFLASLLSPHYFSLVKERTFQPLVTLFHYFTHGYPLVYRLFGLAVHLLNAVLLCRLAENLKASRRSATLAAWMFALFPASTELLNISSFKGHLFAATFILLGLVTGKTEVCLVLGLFAKESALVLAPLSLLNGKTTRTVPVAVICALYLGYRFVYLAAPPPFPITFEYSSLESLAFYLRTLAVPYPLCLERTLPQGPWWIIWLALFVLALYFSRESKPTRFALLWIPISLLPFLHLISFSNVTPVADRYLYLASAGFALVLAFNLPERALVGVVVAYGILTGARNLAYRTERALYDDAAACAPLNPRAHFLSGNAAFRDGDFPAARASYQRVLRLTDSPGAREALENTNRAERAFKP